MDVQRKRPSSPQPIREDVQQGGCGLLIESQHTAVRDVRVQHDDSVLLGHQKVGEAGSGVGLAGGHDHAAVGTGCPVGTVCLLHVL